MQKVHIFQNFMDNIDIESRNSSYINNNNTEVLEEIGVECDDLCIEFIVGFWIEGS